MADAANLLNIKLRPLDWLRYNLFWILCTPLANDLSDRADPLGAGSEAVVMYTAVPYVAAKFGAAGKWAVVSISCLVWPLGASCSTRQADAPGLALMMSHMAGQSRKQYVARTRIALPIATMRGRAGSTSLCSVLTHVQRYGRWSPGW